MRAVVVILLVFCHGSVIGREIVDEEGVACQGDQQHMVEMNASKRETRGLESLPVLPKECIRPSKAFAGLNGKPTIYTKTLILNGGHSANTLRVGLFLVFVLLLSVLNYM